MAAVGKEIASLAAQCLALCQTLASQGQSFTFSLSIGSSFNFSMATPTLASMPHSHIVEDYSNFWETGEVEVYVDAPASLPTSLPPSTTPHYIPSKASYSSVAASVPTKKKANPLICTHCGLSKFGHPGPTGDRCNVPKQPNL